MRHSITIFFLLLAVSVVGQQYDPEKVPKKARALYVQAMEAADESRYAVSLELVNKALNIYPAFLDAQLSKAGLLGEFKKYDQAVEAYQQAFSMDPSYTKEYQLPYAINLMGKGSFDEALVAVNSFLALSGLNESSIKSGEYRRKCIFFAIERKKSDSSNDVLLVVNEGDAVNSPLSEYFPSLTIDQKQIIVTRKVRGGMDEDFYASSKKDSAWDTALPLSGQINTSMKEGAQQISQDGKWLVYTGQYPDGYGNFDIYISILTPEGWSAKMNAGPKVNTQYWESAPCLSADKSELYFSSNRPGGYGGIDLYVSRMMANGKWSEAMNLGPIINTAGDETGPFMHADNQTLYFTSNGHPGYGGEDIYLAKRTSDGFTSPYNLGFPINTIHHESTLTVTADGSKAYYASDREDSRGGMDIYHFDLKPSIRPLPTTWVEGKVYDSLTGKGLSAVVELIDLETKRVVSQVETEMDGSYLTTLPFGKNYAFNVNKKGYLFHSARFALGDSFRQAHFEMNIPLKPFTTGSKIILHNILFETGKSDLLSESLIELDKVVRLMKENPSIKIQISGHTDSIGKANDNLILSTARAKSVVDHLIAQGISGERLRSIGYGASLPIADNGTPEGRALNRRTELLVTEGN
jgi:outer membrane protein OmpA-like peptidoglycan-associated protein/tetratricopeptide (TPR) repeat protein